MALAQIGEFSFIVATLGNTLGVLTREATNTLVGASIVSITLNPLLFRAIGPLDQWMARRRRPMSREPSLTPAPTPSPSHRAVVVGFGPIGRTVARLLRENEITPTVVEMNVDTVRALRSEGVEVIMGDSTQAAVLAAARVEDAASFIVSAAGLPHVKELLRIAREQNPTVQILVRANYLREVSALRAAGADEVVSGEAEVALGLTAAILQRLGATPDQIDRERERVRRELAS